MFKAIWRKIPLFSGLVDCSLSDHWAAVQEVFVVLLFSTVPIWLGSILVCLMGPGLHVDTFRTALVGSIYDGELFIYSTTLLAPVFWIALKREPRAKRAFPSQISHLVLILVVNVIAAGVFGVQESGHHMNTQSAFRTSEVIFIFSLILLYLGTTYHYSLQLPNPADAFKKDEEDFVNRFQEPKQ